MRLCVFLVSCLALAQNDSQLSSYGYDINGRRVPLARQGSSSSPGAYSQSNAGATFNGQPLPLQSIEEKVISEGPEGRVVERVIKRFATFGGVTVTEKQRIEDRPAPDGASHRAVTVFDQDVNGQFQLRMRETSLTRKEGETLTRVNTTVETPDVNGKLALFERRQTVIEGDEKKDFKKDTTVYRKDANGSFEAQEREITKVKLEGGRTDSDSANYRTISTGKLELWEQKVARTVTHPDGSETQVVDIYAAQAPGRADGKGPKLREQQITEKRRDNGGYTETYSVRQPALDSPKLGPAQKVTETVCKGKCQ